MTAPEHDALSAALAEEMDLDAGLADVLKRLDEPPGKPVTDMAPTCRCGGDDVGHVHTREPRARRDLPVEETD